MVHTGSVYAHVGISKQLELMRLEAEQQNHADACKKNGLKMAVQTEAMAEQ